MSTASTASPHHQSKGVDEMLNRTMGIYLKYFNNEQRAQR